MGIFGGGNSSSNTWPTFTGVQLNVAVNTMPIPILWGAGKLGTNLIEYVDFSGHKESSGGKGGKGGTTDYTARSNSHCAKDLSTASLLCSSTRTSSRP